MDWSSINCRHTFLSGVRAAFESMSCYITHRFKSQNHSQVEQAKKCGLNKNSVNEPRSKLNCHWKHFNVIRTTVSTVQDSGFLECTALRVARNFIKHHMPSSLEFRVKENAAVGQLQGVSPVLSRL